MNSEWTKKWKKVLIWFCSYVSLVAYAVVGGYTIVKTQDEDLKKSAKLALVASLIWAAVSAFLTIFYSCLSMSTGNIYNGAYEAYLIIKGIFDILKIIFYAVVIIYVLLAKENVKIETAEPEVEDTVEE